MASGWLIFFFCWEQSSQKRSVSAGLLTRLTQFFGLLEQNECGSLAWLTVQKYIPIKKTMTLHFNPSFNQSVNLAPQTHCVLQIGEHHYGCQKNITFYPKNR